MSKYQNLLRNSHLSCSQLSIVLGSRLVYQSKTFPFSDRTNCFTMRSPLVPALLQISTK
ncbi:hypothetical protein ES319_D07G122100v1 [Gossypium barbadense]|uniref:Uncharacterized protein n=2 Tax=Gossypium TaxID=3633 RepID=A0A5J5QPY7_GOSBA|nr:hypothetical protein ES319_D07G122100v1 [Gossypium barbadense]TYG61207.1 hypothetical protein ES288_D07G129200v1 [Gossypium darwinii]